MGDRSFNGKRLEVARAFAGLNQSGLAEKVGVSQSYVCQLEAGTKVPTADLRAALAVATGFAPEFFESEDGVIFQLHECTFRRRKKTPVETQRRLAACGTIFGSVLTYLLKRIRIPDVNLPSYKVADARDAERIADTVRMTWGLGLDRPLSNLVRVAERHGIVTTRFDAGSDQVDAFSRCGSPRPVIVLNSGRGSASRSRFNVAHEIGHLVLHQGEHSTGDDNQEKPADAFASAFLMPRAGFLRAFPQTGRIDWPTVFRLKGHWGASAAAIVRRAYELERIDAIEYRRAYKYMSANGWLRGEPQEPATEEPEVIVKGLEILRAKKNETMASISRALAISVGAMRQVTGADLPVVSEAGDVPTNNNVVHLSHAKLRPLSN